MKKDSGSERVRAVPAARALAKRMGVDLASVEGTGPGGTILKKDVEAYIRRTEVGEKERGVKGKKTTPLARKVAEKLGVSIEDVEGTGPGGKVTKGDVLRFAGEKEVVSNEKEESLFGKTIPLTRMRRTIASRMVQSAFSAPHIYFFKEVIMDPVLELKDEVREVAFEKHGVSLSVNDFILKAVAQTLADFPFLNAMVLEEGVKIFPEINVGLAVAVPDGLVVPVIRNAREKDLFQIARERAKLVDRARKGALTLKDIEGGSFTVSSLAGYGIDAFTAIINPPQTGILSVGVTEARPVVLGNEVVPARTAIFGLSVDHRVVDGEMAARFLVDLKRRLERPATLLI